MTLSIVLFTLSALPFQADRFAAAGELVSRNLPAARFLIEDQFQFVGKVPFRIRDIAVGERFVFADSDDTGKVKRLWIAHFESILPTSDEIFRYSFVNATPRGGLRWRINTFAYSNRAAAKNNPDGEAAATAAFINRQGLTFGDIWRMARFVTVTHENRRHELIIFYIEPVDNENMAMTDFYDSAGRDTPAWQKFSKGLTKRGLASWQIEPSTGH